VLLSLVPDDELPALIEDSMSLPPIDLTQPAIAYADLSVFMLVPAPRPGFAALAQSLPPVQLTGAVPPVLNNRKPIDLLRFFHGPVPVAPPSTTWQTAIGSQVYGYYLRRRSAPVYLSLTTIALVAVPGAAAGEFTLTASVTPEAATGSVTFMDGATTLGSAALSQGSTSLDVPALASGTHTLTAVYSGDTFFAGSSSAPLEQTV
jgi:Bacterial Ig-like domain (group 3)